MTKKISVSLLILLGFTISLVAQDNAVKSIMTKKYDPATNLIVWPDEFNPQKANFFMYNEIEINAKPEVVWDILIDATKWHSFYKGVQSPVIILDSTAKVLKNGLAFKLHTMGLHLEPVMKEFVPNERMAWEVRARNISGYHAWVIVPTANGCRLITAESQNGFLTFMQKVFQPNKLLKLHDIWLSELKIKSENQ